MTVPPTRALAVEIDGVHTDLVMSRFGATLLLVLTQRAKVGHMVEAVCDGGADEARTYSVDVRLGARDDPVPEIFARHLVALLADHNGPDTRLVLGIAMREREPPPSTLQAVLAVVRANVDFWGAREEGDML